MKIRSFAVAVCAAMMVGFSSFGDENSFTGSTKGSWFVDGNWSLERVPTAEDDVVINGKTVNAAGSIVAKSLTVSGTAGVLNLGSETERPNVTATIGEDLSVTNGAKLYVYAGRLADYVTKYEAGTDAFHAAIYANANVVQVGGSFTVGASSFVYPDNDKLTGTPVFFKVGGDFTLEEGATVSADQRGWGWLETATVTKPKGAASGKFKVGNTASTPCFSLATGCGTNSTKSSASYGGQGYYTTQNAKAARPTYGFDVAPYLPGSPNTAVYSQPDTKAGGRAGGSVCVFAAGNAILSGTLSAAPATSGQMRGSGGSVWVVAHAIELGEALKVSAFGGGDSQAGYYPSGGGRVAFEAGVTDDDIQAFVVGERPEHLTYEVLSFDGLNVAGGKNSNSSTSAGAGTAVNVYSVAQKTALTIAGSPFNAASEGVVYGTQGVDYGEVSYSVTDYGADADDPANVRYTCVGYVVSNATSEIAHETGTTATFTLVNGEGPYTLVWLWRKRETKMKVSVPDAALGTVEVNGETLDEDAELWFGEAATVSLEAVPADGCAFNCWVGDVDAAQMRHAEIEVTADVSRSLRPMLYVEGEVSDRYWVSGKTGLYYSAENWEGGIVPAPQDRVFVTNGTCTARDVLEASALTVGEKGKVVVSDVADVRIAGDLTLSGSGKLTVNAVPLAGERTMATGSTVVWIGGSLLIRDKAVLRPVSDAWTGGSALFNVKGGFVLEEDATIDGATAGWSWVAYEGTKSPEALDTSNGYQTKALGRGNYYTTGASYGGKGGYVNGTPQSPYGEANAPIYPGSPTGIYKTNPFVAGGGLVRIHAGGRATVNGTIDVSGDTLKYGGSSGGGIWLTADVCAFGSSAKLLANGGDSNYNSTGAGGRIAIGCGLTSRHLADLARTGKCSRHAKGRALFEAKYPGTAVEVKPGVYTTGNAEEGSFVYYPASGLMVLVKGDGAGDPKPAEYPWQGVGEEPSEEPVQPSDEPTPENPPEEGQVPTLPRVAGLSDTEQGLYEKVVAAFDAVNPIDETTGGRKYISFGFITDEHSCKRVEGDDAATDPVRDYWYYGGASLTKCDHSIRLLGAVSGKVGLDAVFNGGDFATGNSIVGLTDEEYLGQVGFVKGLFAQYLPSTPFFTVDGNHDRNYPAGTVNGQSVPGHVWNDAQWRTALELFNSDVSQNVDVQVTMHRDLAHPTVGSENPGTYVGNSYHVDCTRLMAAGKPNVRFVCVSEYDSTPGNGKLLRMYDGFQFYDPVTQKLIDPAKTPENTLICIISHGNMGTALDQAASGYLNAGSRKGASTQQAQLNSNLGTHKGLGFVGSVAGHAHQTLVKPIDEDGVRKSSCVQVKECYAGHSSTSASGYRFSLFTVDTDRKLLHETRLVNGKATNYSTIIDMK